MLFVHYPKCSTCQKARAWLVTDTSIAHPSSRDRKPPFPRRSSS